jgi:hypothetical protein
MRNDIDYKLLVNFCPLSNLHRRLCAPGSTFRRYWDVAVLFALLYTYISTPLHLAYALQRSDFEDQASRLAPDYLLDTLLLADLVSTTTSTCYHIDWFFLAFLCTWLGRF